MSLFSLGFFMAGVVAKSLFNILIRLSSPSLNFHVARCFDLCRFSSSLDSLFSYRGTDELSGCSRDEFLGSAT